MFFWPDNFHAWQANDSAIFDGEDGRDGAMLQCKYCGSEFVSWQETPRGWRLMDHTGKLHTCEQYRKAKEKQKCSKQRKSSSTF